MTTCTRLIKSDTGHRVLGHEGKCRHLHGHEYNFEITAAADSLDSIGRVIDFSVIKERVGGWIDNNWDHNMLLYSKDESAIKAMELVEDGRPPFIADWNPTAENIADYVLREVCPLVLQGTGVVVTQVKVWETQNCFATAVL